MTSAKDSEHTEHLGGIKVDNKGQGEAMAYAFIAIMVIIVLALFIFGGPIYGVWASEQNGKAQLAQATYSKQIAVQEAQAKMDSAKLLAEAEVERAKGVAQANQIIGDSLKGNEEYLRYLYINGVTENMNGKSQIIYLPTEAGIPILEANRLEESK